MVLLEAHIKSKGGEIAVTLIPASLDTAKQYKAYEAACEAAKDMLNIVVCTSLPDQERIFWPYGDVEWYIGIDEAFCTGNEEVMKAIWGYPPPIQSVS
jgi:hypothetical protein